ncbi:MAG: hypothetical protein SNJ72_06350 [Fimbriimonadales bacterium]
MSSAIILSLLGSVISLLLGEGSSLLAELMRQSPLLKIVLMLLLGGFALGLVGHLIGLWHATRMTALLHLEHGLILLARTREGVYKYQIGWHEIAPPEQSHHRNWLNQLSYLMHLITGGLGHTIALVLLDLPREYLLSHAFYPRRSIRIFTTQNLTREYAFFTLLTAFCLEHWLANGKLAYDAGYLPSEAAPFIVVDLRTRRVRAYPLRHVFLDETPYEYEDPESHNPDGSRVEADQSLPTPDENRSQRTVLPGFAVPYKNGYWVRAGWGLIARIEAGIKASETATQVPTEAPKPA